MDPNVSSATVDASALDVSCSLMYLQQMQKGMSVSSVMSAICMLFVLLIDVGYGMSGST